MVTEGHYDLHCLLDYDEGIPMDEFVIFYKATSRYMAERSRQMVQVFSVAIGSMFDKKVFKDFNDTINRIVKKLSPEAEARATKSPEGRRQRMIHTAMELEKLRPLMG
jgi:hypothetical protein